MQPVEAASVFHARQVLKLKSALISASRFISFSFCRYIRPTASSSDTVYFVLKVTGVTGTQLCWLASHTESRGRKNIHVHVLFVINL